MTALCEVREEETQGKDISREYEEVKNQTKRKSRRKGVADRRMSQSKRMNRLDALFAPIPDGGVARDLPLDYASTALTH